MSRSPSPQGTLHSGSKLFISNLNYDTDEQALEQRFQESGTISECKIIRDTTTRQSRGFGFLTYQNPTDAGEAILRFNGTEIDGKEIRIEFAKKSRPRNQRERSRSPVGDGKDQTGKNLYVTNLSYSTQEEDLRGIFDEFGSIADCKIVRDFETRKSRGFGFVTFSELEDANKARNRLNGREIEGREIRIEVAKQPRSAGKREERRRSPEHHRRERRRHSRSPEYRRRDSPPRRSPRRDSPPRRSPRRDSPPGRPPRRDSPVARRSPRRDSSPPRRSPRRYY